MIWLPEAVPETKEEVLASAPQPDVVTAAVERGVDRVIHFSRINGLKGILASGAVLARLDLPEEARLKHVYEPNASDRSRDELWHRYVNLSLGRINRLMFNASKGWHDGDPWVILNFSPHVLGDRGVVFCTTNNAYPTVHRHRGLAGFEQLFAERVPWGYYGSVRSRVSCTPADPTDHQAEILYPGALGLDRLEAITVGDEETYEIVVALFANFAFSARIVQSAEAFR